MNRTRTVLFLCAVGQMLSIAMGAAAQPVTTVLTHGYSLDASKGPWVEGMADAIIARSGGVGAVCRYEQAGGAWRIVSGELNEAQPVVLIYRWLEDFDKIGAQWGYAEGAADALYAALRDPHFEDFDGTPLPPIQLVNDHHLHFVGHSRGAVVNSETVERFANAGISIDHVTTLDPHPVNGTLDPPFDYDWGDPTPVKWSNVVWADNDWRADGGGFNSLDFDGIPIPDAFNTLLDEDALECCGYGFSHSDVHLWYHGTIDLSPNPCDGEQCITDQMRNSWWPDGYAKVGYYFARLGGGAADRPELPLGAEPGDTPTIYNGGFDQGSHAGWVHHGGQITGQVVAEEGEIFLKFGAGLGNTGLHNRFLLPAQADRLVVDTRVFTPAGAETVEFALIDLAGSEHDLGAFPLDESGTWQRGRVLPISSMIPRVLKYRLIVRIVSDGQVMSIVGVDNLRILASMPAELLNASVVFGSLVAGGVAELLDSDDDHLQTRSTFGFTAFEPNLMELVVAAASTVESPGTLDLTIESRINHPTGLARIRLRNWGSGVFVEVGAHALSTTETTETIEGIDATSYVRDADGRIDLSVKHVVLAVFSAIGFDSFFDQVGIDVR